LHERDKKVEINTQLPDPEDELIGAKSFWDVRRPAYAPTVPSTATKSSTMTSLTITFTIIRLLKYTVAKG